MLPLVPTYLVQLPILSLYLSYLSLSPAAQHFLHHPVPRAIIISPLSNCACILPDPPYSTLGPSNISQPKGTAGHAPTPLWWENIDNFSWLLEMGPWKLYKLGSVMFNVTAASCGAESPAVFCTAATLAFSNSYKMMCLPHTTHFLYLERFFFFLIPFSFIFFSFHFHCCIFKLKFLDSPYFLQLFDF